MYIVKYLHFYRELIQRELNRQGQVFYIHNKIATIYERADSIQQLLPECRIGVIHAKMEDEKAPLGTQLVIITKADLDELISKAANGNTSLKSNKAPLTSEARAQSTKRK